MLHGSVLESHSIDLTRSRVELAPSAPAAGSVVRRTVVFEEVSLLKWTGTSFGSAALRVSVIGLERLGPGEPWRVYLRNGDFGELELTCARVMCGGDEVTGIGRSYRH